MKNKLILILGLLIWGFGFYMLIATKTIQTNVPGDPHGPEGALIGGAAGAAAGTGAGLMIGGIGVAACGTGVGIPVGVVCLGLAAILGAGGAVAGKLAGDHLVPAEPTVIETLVPMFPQELTTTVLLLGFAVVIWGLFRILKERRKKTKQLEIV